MTVDTRTNIDLDTAVLPIMESFYTLQGEGFHTGRAAYFIRLAGCDVGCHWCDVKESWNTDIHPRKTIAQIVAGAIKFPSRLAVITGGEPLMYDLSALTGALKSAGFQTNIETSGVYPLSGIWDWVCVSPKKFKEPLPSVLPFAHELKMIVYNQSDFDFAEKYAVKVPVSCQLLLQPEWGRQTEMLPAMIAYVKQHPQWRISLQTHKFMNIP